MSQFANLRRNSMDIASLVGAATKDSKAETKSSGKDERFWKPTVDKAGNGYAVIRFLPSMDAEELPWVRYWDHGFKGPTGKYYIEKSLTSIGQTDPVGEMNQKLWNSGIESDKEICRQRKRRLHYVSNIMVVSDPANPDNEGKVFLYEYGKKIFDKIMDLMQPQFPDEKPVNPFDMWEGADFTMKIRKVDGYRNYDKSEFKSTSALLEGDDAKLEAVFNKMYNLGEFVDPAKYKTYDELKKHLMDVLGESTSAVSAATAMAMANETQAAAPKYETAEAADIAEETATEAPQMEASEEDDTLSYFAKLANEA